MELQDLNHEERVVSVALFSFVVAADNVGSPDEAEHVADIAKAYGDEYTQLLDEAVKYHKTETEFKALVAKVENQEARNLIYGTVMDCASEDGIEHKEAEFLSWLANEWGIKVQDVE
jgi:hypothetical protein